MEEQEQKQQETTTGTTPKTNVTHNLDTGRDEPLQKSGEEDESVMDYASGSGGGSAGDGGAS